MWIFSKSALLLLRFAATHLLLSLSFCRAGLLPSAEVGLAGSEADPIDGVLKEVKYNDAPELVTNEIPRNFAAEDSKQKTDKFIGMFLLF